MTKNRSIKIAVLVLALALITSCFVGTTFARYTSTSEGTTTLNVAAFSIFVNENEIVTEAAEGNDFTFNHTIVDTKDGNADAEVADNMIAPGTKGQFSFKVQNKSDVTVVCKVVELELSQALPIQFALSDSANDEDWEADFEDLSFSNLTIAHDDDTEKTVTVYWRWAFGDDVVDNQYADLGTVTATITLNVEQVD